MKEKRDSFLTQKDPTGISQEQGLEEKEITHLENALKDREEQLEQLQEKFSNIKQMNQDLLAKIQDLENSVRQIRETKQFLNNQNYELIQTLNGILEQLDIVPFSDSQIFLIEI
ncbi:MAG: hypothetical protein HWD61_13425 [Parachlamydiaceae bacterium]|nr:MAG: hypothetical protein HWD61_13425 [Parachlamydiaceae bacterium]